jgi:lipoate---protein ligase
MTQKGERMFDVLDSGTGTAKANMNLDRSLLSMLPELKKPLLHFYSWKGNCATYGHFIDPYSILDEEKLSAHDIEFVKRPTGGGIVFHNGTMSFSVLIPASHPLYSSNTGRSYIAINSIVINALKAFSGNTLDPHLIIEEPPPHSPQCEYFCMAKLSPYDIIIDGKKVGGSAQRITRKGLLHQGFLSLCVKPSLALRSILLPNDDLFKAFTTTTLPLLGEDCNISQLHDTQQEIKKTLTDAFNEACALGPVS